MLFDCATLTLSTQHGVLTMRKVTQTIANAWKNHTKASCGNTITDGKQVFLHGNLIAWRDDSPLTWNFTLAGWNTPTTRERLNGLLNAIGADKCAFYQKDFEPYFIDLEGKHTSIDSDEIITIRFID